MSIDERKRHALYQRLDELLDGEHADTLMELLPPAGWADVATKQDIGHLGAEIRGLEQRMELRFEGVDHKLESLESRLRADLRSELHAALRGQTWAILGVLLVAIVVSEILSRVG
jgi:hypothetical protein